jgi:hypothetical protein
MAKTIAVGFGEFLGALDPERRSWFQHADRFRGVIERW